MNYMTVKADELRKNFGSHYFCYFSDQAFEANSSEVSNIIGLDNPYELPFLNKEIVTHFLKNYPKNPVMSVRESLEPIVSSNGFNNIEDATDKATHDSVKEFASSVEAILKFNLLFTFFKTLSFLKLLKDPKGIKAKKIKAFKAMRKLATQVENNNIIIGFLGLPDCSMPTNIPSVGTPLWVVDLLMRHDDTPPSVIACKVSKINAYEDFGYDEEVEEGFDTTEKQEQVSNKLTVTVSLEQLEKHGNWNFYSSFTLSSEKLKELDSTGKVEESSSSCVIFKKQEDAIQCALDCLQEKTSILNEEAKKLTKTLHDLEGQGKNRCF
jgi:hypothetical protein